MAGIATIRGTAIVPGVSRNRRLYTRELLAAAVARARERIKAGPPMTMLTHHGAEDDSSRIVGRLTDLAQREDGSLAFAAELADTAHGRDLAALVTGDEPFLEGVSIRGWWDGEVRTIQHNGQRVETADSLTLDGLDFTKTPGVIGARVEGSGKLARETADGRVLVYESVTEATARPIQRPHGDVSYADNGYLRDQVRRYPLTSRELAVEAWRQFSDPGVAARYTPKQLKRARGRIRAAMEEFEQMAGPATRFSDVTEYYGDTSGGQGGFCIDAYNGPTCLTLRVAGIDPAELRVIASAAMDAAVSALAALDPDMDADIDVAGAPHADTDGDMETRGVPDDNQMESAPQPVPYAAAGLPLTPEQAAVLRASRLTESLPPGTPVTAALANQAIAVHNRALTSTAPAAPVGETTEHQEVPAVSEQPTTAAVAEAATTPAAAATITLTQEQFGALLDRIGAVPAAPAAPAAETAPAAPAAPPVVESQEQMIARLITTGVATAVETLKADLRTEMQEAGPRRVGLAIKTTTTESEVPSSEKAFYELPAEKRDQLERDSLLRAFGFAK